MTGQIINTRTAGRVLCRSNIKYTVQKKRLHIPVGRPR